MKKLRIILHETHFDYSIVRFSLNKKINTHVSLQNNKNREGKFKKNLNK